MNHSADASALAVMGSVGLSGSELAIALLEQSDDCIKILDLDGRLEFMNCGGMKAMEIDRPELVLGKLWWELWPEPAQAFVRRNFRDAAQGREVSFEANCPTARGSPRRWSVSMRPMLASVGTVVSVLSTSRDITNEK